MAGADGKSLLGRVEIARSPQEVFDFLTDMANWAHLDEALRAIVGRRTRGLRRLPVVVPLALAIAATGCASPPRELPTRPPTPDGWMTIVVGSGDLRIALPPWLIPFETSETLFANEPPMAGGDAFFELMAEGPRTAIPQPAPGESLERWLEQRVGLWGPGEGAARPVELPSGQGVVIERVRADPPHPWRLAAYAIRTQVGVAYLLMDGPPESWTSREDDAAFIPLLLELGPGGPT